MPTPLPIVVLISGTGSNLQSLIQARDAGSLPVNLQAVIANRADAQGLARAENAGIPTRVIDHKQFSRRADFDAALSAAIATLAVELIVLAGFMRRLTEAFVDQYEGRMVNLHPSLLPAYRGLHTYERCLADGVTMHGSSVHFVTHALDGGPVIAQAPVAVQAGDTPETLKARVQAREHVLLPEVLRWFAARRVSLHGGSVYLDGRPLPKPIRLTENNELIFPDSRETLPAGGVPDTTSAQRDG